jgi:hypothetical protein
MRHHPRRRASAVTPVLSCIDSPRWLVEPLARRVKISRHSRVHNPVTPSADEVSEEDGGVFAEVNPGIDCPDGTDFTMEDPQDLIDHPLNACRSELGT